MHLPQLQQGLRLFVHVSQTIRSQHEREKQCKQLLKDLPNEPVCSKTLCFLTSLEIVVRSFPKTSAILLKDDPLSSSDCMVDLASISKCFCFSISGSFPPDRALRMTDIHATVFLGTSKFHLWLTHASEEVNSHLCGNLLLQLTNTKGAFFIGRLYAGKNVKYPR